MPPKTAKINNPAGSKPRRAINLSFQEIISSIRGAALGEYLEAKPEVYDVLLCEQDLSGNIDEFMDQNVPISDVIFFLGTNKSVFNSVDCAHELNSRKNIKFLFYL